MNRFKTAFGKWVVKYRWWIIVGTILVVLTAGSGVRFLKISNDTRAFFSEKNPQLQAFEALENTYTKDQIVLFAIAPKDGNVFTRETLAAVEELTEASWQMPYSSRVDSITNFQHTRAEEDDLIVEDLIQNGESLSDTDLERVKRIALSEPLLVNKLISPSGHVTGVYVTVLPPGKSPEEVTEVTAFARKLAGDLRKKNPDIDVYLTGGIIMDNAFGEASQKDMSTLYPLMFLTLIVLMGLMLRSFIGTFATLIIILISMVTGLGLAGWLGIVITAASVNAPTLIFTLAVADSVHILTTMFHQRHLGKAKREAIAESLRINLQPVFLTSATTAIGFLTMNFSDAPPFRDLGNIVAMGVMAAFVYSVLFLPALVAVLPMRVKQRQKRSGCCSCAWLANFVIRRRKPVFWGTLLAVVFLSIGISRIELNDKFLEYFDESYEVRRATDFVLENLSGWDMIEYSLESGEPGGINNPEYLATVEEFAKWYRKQQKVVHVNTITETMKRLNKNMHGDDESYYRIPEQRDLAAQYLLLYEMSLPFGLDLNNQINVDKSSTRMTATLRDMSATELREMDEKARNWLQANAPKSMYTYGTSLSIMWAHITGRNIKSMLSASFWAIVLISGILMFSLRSFKLGLVSLIPNMTPAVMAFGIWGMIVGQVGLGLSVIVAMTIGIVVDDTVHFLSKYLRARREYGMIPPEAVRYSFNTVGTAMWVTTVVLVAGFAVLALSHYKMNSDMGLMTAITITLALGMDFLLLPTLLMNVDRKTGKLADESKEKTGETVDNDLDVVPDAVSVAVAESRSGRDS
ncbi:MMPL family transporter [bacterium]|nr:MMPL family transporter [bacterium]